MLLNEPSRCAFKQRPSRWDELSVTAWEGVGMFWGGAVPVFSIDCRGSRDGQRAEGGRNWVWKGPSEGTGSNPRGGLVPHMAPGPYAGLGLCPPWHQVHMQGWVCAPHGTGSNPGLGLCPTWHRIRPQGWVCAPHGTRSICRAEFVPHMALDPTPGVGLCPTWHQVHMQGWVCAPHGTGSDPRPGFVPHMELDPTPGLGLCPPWHWI